MTVETIPETGTYFKRGKRMVEVVGTVSGDGGDAYAVEVRNIVTETTSEIPLEDLGKWTLIEADEEVPDGC